MALEIDGDLKDWKAGVPPHWQYATIDAPEADVGTYFGAKRHVYPNVWVAEAWNNWRTLRLSVNQILLANGPRLSLPDTAQNSAAISIIRQCSAELCIATASFTDSPSRLTVLLRSSANSQLNILHRCPLSDPAVIHRGDGRAECSRRARLRRRAIAAYQRDDGDPTGWLAG